MKLSHAERRLNEAYREILLLPAGRLVLRDLLRRTGLLEPTCAPGAALTNETFWREGRRSIGLELVGKLNDLTPHAYPGLAHESANEMVEPAAQVRAEEEDNG